MHLRPGPRVRHVVKKSILQESQRRLNPREEIDHLTNAAWIEPNGVQPVKVEFLEKGNLSQASECHGSLNLIKSFASPKLYITPSPAVNIARKAAQPLEEARGRTDRKPSTPCITMGFHATNTNDPPEVRNWRVHLLAFAVSMSAVAMGYDTGFIGGTQTLPSFKRDFGLGVKDQFTRDTLSGNIVSTFQAGTFFGSLLTFPIVEKFGRKKGMVMAAVIFCVGAAIMTASAGRLSMIYVGRAITGLGIGSASLIVPVYIAEISPPSIRGRLVGMFEIMSQGGSMLGFWINYIVNRTIDPHGRTQWLVPTGLQLLPGTLLFIGALLAPESPRWLCKEDNWEEARKNLLYLRMLPQDHEYIREELAGIKEQIEFEKAQTGGKKFTEKLKELLLKGNRNRIAIGLILMCCQNMTGVNIITYYSPRIFETLGLTGTSTKLFATGFYGVAKTLGMVIFSFWLVERVGRRKGLIYGAFIGSIPMWYIGGYVMKADPARVAAEGNYSRNGWGYLAMVCVYLYGFIYCMTWQGITWVYCSEIFPIGIRMLCVAITTADQWLWSFIVSRTTPYMITSLGYGTYFFFASLMILMGIWAFFFVPETKGRSLEDMDRLFGVPGHGGEDVEKRSEDKLSVLKDEVKCKTKMKDSELSLEDQRIEDAR